MHVTFVPSKKDDRCSHQGEERLVKVSEGSEKRVTVVCYSGEMGVKKLHKT